MKNKFLLFSFLLLSGSMFSQIIRITLPDTVSHWTKVNKVGLDLTQTSFVNWNAGGNNSISGLVKTNFKRDYEFKRIKWTNELITRYGINKQEGQEYRKTDDQFLITSTAGFKTDTLSNWYYGGKFSFNTQFANGYSYPNTTKAISKPFAPAYLFLGIGAEYYKSEFAFKTYLSPLTLKTTMVFDTFLANQGAYGVDKAIYDLEGNVLMKGKRSRSEIGILITNQWEREIFENISLEHRISLYSDYLNNFGNIDVDWQLNFTLKVNKYVNASISNNIIYDDDIKSKEEVNGEQVIKGPKIQLKQIIGIGATYSF